MFANGVGTGGRAGRTAGDRLRAVPRRAVRPDDPRRSRRRRRQDRAGRRRRHAVAGKPFIGCQRGKRSLALDLKAPAGLDVARRLMSGADVVHHNMTRGVATKLGIDYPACRGRARRTSSTATPTPTACPSRSAASAVSTRSTRRRRGSSTRRAPAHAGNTPLYIRFGMCDTSNAMLSVVGVLLALVHRQRTGEGQELWTSLHDGGIIFSSDMWLGPDGAPWDRPHLDAGLHGLAPTLPLYRTQDEGWICVAAVDARAGRAAPGRRCGSRTLEAGVRLEDGPAVDPPARRRRRAERDPGRQQGRRGRAPRRRQRPARPGDALRPPGPRPAAPVRRRSSTSRTRRASSPGRRRWSASTAATILREAGFADGDIDALVSSGVVRETDPSGAGYGMVV